MVYDESKLLGKEPNIPESNGDEGITTVFTDLDITTGVFTMEKYQEVKTKLKEGKSESADGILPEVFNLMRP